MPYRSLASDARELLLGGGQPARLLDAELPFRGEIAHCRHDQSETGGRIVAAAREPPLQNEQVPLQLRIGRDRARPIAREWRAPPGSS